MGSRSLRARIPHSDNLDTVKLNVYFPKQYLVSFHTGYIDPNLDTLVNFETASIGMGNNTNGH